VETAALAGAFMLNVNQGWKTGRPDFIVMKHAIDFAFENFSPYCFGTILSGIY
jgi:hypothetical protein